MEKRIEIHYYAQFREARGRASETVQTGAASPRELLAELALTGSLMGETHLKVAVNDEFASWETELQDGDLVVFLAPAAGG